MREIKFQVFTTDWEGVNKCFDGYFLHVLDNGRYKVAFTNSDKDKEFITTSRENIRFFTGIIDKNGKEIYEGDIVRIKGHALQRDKRGIGIDIDGNYVVKWSEKMELILAPSPESKEGCLLSKNLHYIEVIGNIFQDGDLLRDS